MKRFFGRFRIIAATMLLLLTPVIGVSAEELVTLNLGHVGHDHQIAIYVGADQGRDLEALYGVYLAPLKDREVYELFDQGRKVARVHFIRVEGGSGMPAAMERGDIEVGLGGLGPVAKFIDKGAPFKVLAPLNNDGDSLILRPDYPADSWDQFVSRVRDSDKPVKIGYKAPMAVAYMILTKALAEEGIRFGQDPVGPDGKPVQVITVNLQGSSNMVSSLESGIVDGVVANEPDPARLVHRNVGKKVADLSALPPKGKWEGHPCCIVAATDSVLRTKREAVKSLLKVIMAGADLMAQNPELAYAAESRWTKTPDAVARKSVPSVSYIRRPDEQWLKAVDTWVGLMISMKHFREDTLKKAPEEVRNDILDLGPVNEALAGMHLQSDR